MLFRNTAFNLLIIGIFALYISSCGDDSSTNVSPSNITCTADVTGDTAFTFSSKSGLIINSSSASEYLIIQANIVNNNNTVTNLTIWLKDTGKYDVPFEFTSFGNYSILSFNGGEVSYKSVVGTLTFLEKSNKRIKANFSFKANIQDASMKEIEVKNGAFDFSL